MSIFDLFVYIMMGFGGVLLIFLVIAKKRMDNNEPVFGWQRKQYLEEQSGEQSSKAKPKIDKKDKNTETLKDLMEIKDIRYGIFEKTRNEYCLIISTDSVNFDLLNDGARSSIILGYQSLFRTIKFPVQILGQAVRQDLRKDERRFNENLKNANAETKDYNKKVFKHIKERSEKEFRVARKVYYIVTYVYQPSRMGQLTPEQKEKRIMQELSMRARTVTSMLRRAHIESYLLDSLQAMEVMKRAINRDRMIHTPIESVVEDGKEKLTAYITADVTSLPGYEDLVHDVEEVREIVRDFEEEKQAVNQ
ncbi:hypothetical protein J2S74_002970 [Evansella vedderi]|uniref:Uncharacterized protein n=1 Tax=Evansella vedderi TaxID=38282 RepID=A0ABT9ZWI8_9BACI|nr:hypothetical protein [Evansella vedderi]MDQ0255588.1 hypothetical protein [Evansella vedderi]